MSERVEINFSIMPTSNLPTIISMIIINLKILHINIFPIVNYKYTRALDVIYYYDCSF